MVKSLSDLNVVAKQDRHTILKTLKNRIEHLEKNKTLMKSSEIIVNQYIMMNAQAMILEDLGAIRADADLIRGAHYYQDQK